MGAKWRKRKGDWRPHIKEKMSQEQAHHHGKVGEDEWRERERGGNEIYASNEV